MPRQTTASAMKVLHVTEASGGGVLQVITQLARHQQLLGVQVSVAVTERFDSPSPDELGLRFANCSVTQLGDGSTLKKLWRIFWFVRKVLVNSTGDVIHLHSSYAGLAGRFARLTVRRPTPTVVYSAHAFGFLRTDLSRPVRGAIRTAEAFLARASDGTLAISASEADLARQIGSPQQVRLLSNCLELPALSSPSQAPIVVANIGRLVSQKGPDRFAVAADRFAEEAKFVWIGGRTSDSNDLPMGENVEVTGNLPRHVALERLSSASIHLFTSKWEGMPLALMESQAMGIPSIAWACPGTLDVVVEGETGFLVDNEAEMLTRLSDLLKNKTLRDSMAATARSIRSRFSDEGYGERSIDAYRELAVVGQRRKRRDKKRDQESVD